MKPNRDITEEDFIEAAEWWQRSLHGAPDEQARLEVWLDEDPVHEEAFAYIKSTWESFDEHPTSPGMLKLRTEVLGKAEKTWQQRLQPEMVSRRVALTGMAAGITAAIATPIALLMANRARETITTAVGEQRVSQLRDGSRVTLDANSKLIVDFTDSVRQIDLISGRAYFDVAKDQSRPFQVRARDNTVTAVGTAFTVEVRKEQVSVALFEGRINVAKNNKTSETLEHFEDVQPAQKVVIQENLSTPPVYKAVDETEELAWRNSQLFFTEEPLGDVIDRMNDYSHVKITVEGSAANIHVSGMYIAGQTDAFVDALQKFHPVKANYEDNRVTIVSNK